MAVTKVTNAAVDNLRIVEFFDPNARFNFGTDDEVSLVSRDGYELVLKGTDFDFNSNDVPTDGTITDVFLYDPRGVLVGRIEDLSHSLEDYYDTVAVDGRPGEFTSDILGGADTITGGSADDYLEGYDGDDRISGGVGFDLLLGDGGNDTINGGHGEDDIDGGVGNDVVSGGNDDDLIYGFDGKDKLNGDAGWDTIEGEAGNDTLNGGSGRDELYGGRDNDKLNGQGGDDSLDGGSGNDTLTGGPGQDVLYGGLGRDQFAFRSQDDKADFVLDFYRGEDKLAFHASGFDNLGPDFDLVVGRDPSAGSGDPTFLFQTGSHNLFYDADGTGGADKILVAKLEDVTNLSKSDFLIV